jgi:hypothetical protein
MPAKGWIGSVSHADGRIRVIVKPAFQGIFEHPIDQKLALRDQPHAVAQFKPIEIPAP